MSISRKTVISNAETWLNPPVPYDQKATKDGYRTDCSGYVSMAWELAKPGRSTHILADICTSISKEDLKSGDILLKKATSSESGHVTIFSHWDTDEDKKGNYIGYEEAGGSVRESRKVSIPYPYFSKGDSYFPYKYDNIID